MFYLFNRRRHSQLLELDAKALDTMGLQPDFKKAVLDAQNRGYRVFCIGRGNIDSNENNADYEHIEYLAGFDYRDIVTLDYHDPRQPARYDWAVVVEDRPVYRRSAPRKDA